MSRELRLTREQERIRIQGLRILARMIVRAHLASLLEGPAQRNGAKPGNDGEGSEAPEGEISERFGEDGG